MAITTLLFVVVARGRWGWRWPVLAGFLGVFLSIDTVFLGANLVKIPQGGWFPLVVAGLLVSIMTTWKRGSFLAWQREQDLEMSLEALLAQLAAAPPLRPPGPAIVLSANPAGPPPHSWPISATTASCMRRCCSPRCRSPTCRGSRSLNG